MRQDCLAVQTELKAMSAEQLEALLQDLLHRFDSR
jgi:ribosomal protein L29